MIGELIGRVFASRNEAHIEHWKSESYAKHIALGSFYDGAIEVLDKIVEAYNGYFDELPAVEEQGGITGDIAEHLKDELDWIVENRKEIAEEIEFIENLVDELTAVYVKTVYLLRMT